MFQKVPCQICHLSGLGWLVNQQNPSGYWQVKGGNLGQIISFHFGFCPFMIRFVKVQVFLKVLVVFGGGT